MRICNIWTGHYCIGQVYVIVAVRAERGDALAPRRHRAAARLRLDLSDRWRREHRGNEERDREDAHGAVL